MKWLAEHWPQVAALAGLAVLVGLAIWDHVRRPKQPPADPGDGPPDKNIW